MTRSNPITHFNLLTALALILLAGIWSPARREDAEAVEPFHDRSVFLIAPLIGWNRNELNLPTRGPLPASTLTDAEEEYGLFAFYATPRITINNMFFSTRANGTDIRGNLTFLNLYGDPEALLTWNAGAGYL